MQDQQEESASRIRDHTAHAEDAIAALPHLMAGGT